MNEDEIYSFEDRTYLNPTTSRDEQLSFIDTLRETQAKNTAQIRTDTYNLGSPLPSNLGGLSGAEDTFIARYQTPQTEQTVADLRTAAQQSALNQALTNLQTAYKKRYNDAMLNYQQRAAKASATPSTNPSNTGNELPIDTNTGSGTGARTNELIEQVRGEFSEGTFPQAEEMFQKTVDAINSGDSSKAQTIPFFVPHTQTGVPTAPGTESVNTGTIYRDKNGNVTGAFYMGKEYNANDAMNLLQELIKQNRLYSTSGKKFTTFDFTVDTSSNGLSAPAGVPISNPFWE